MIRPAETRDIPVILQLFIDLLDYLKGQNQDYNLDDDRDKVIGGVLNLIVAMMATPNKVVLVQEIDGQVTHFCAGGIARLPEFCKHEVLGELNWLYPLSAAAKPLVTAFDVWAQGCGATARWGFAAPECKASQALMVRDKMRLEILQFLKPYQEA